MGKQTGTNPKYRRESMKLQRLKRGSARDLGFTEPYPAKLISFYTRRTFFLRSAENIGINHSAGSSREKEVVQDG